MTDFVIHFLLCNFFLCAITGIFVITKRLLTNHLTSRMQFNLWYMWAGILTVPFLPVNLLNFPQIFSWFEKLVKIVLPNHKGLSQTATGTTLSEPITPLNDFALSVSRQTSSSAVLVLCMIWLAGILAVVVVMIKAHIRLRAIKKSALPLQNNEVLALYHDCLHELNIKRNIPLHPIGIRFARYNICCCMNFHITSTKIIALIICWNLPAFSIGLIPWYGTPQRKCAVTRKSPAIPPSSDWRKILFHLRILFSHGMAPSTPLKHGMQTKPFLLPCNPPSTGTFRR